MWNLQTYYFKLDFHKVDHHTGDKWLIHSTKRRKDSCKAWNSPVEYPIRECKHDIKEPKGNMLNPIFKENFQGQKHLINRIQCKQKLDMTKKAMNKHSLVYFLWYQELHFDIWVFNQARVFWGHLRRFRTLIALDTLCSKPPPTSPWRIWQSVSRALPIRFLAMWHQLVMVVLYEQYILTSYSLF